MKNGTLNFVAVIYLICIFACGQKPVKTENEKKQDSLPAERNSTGRIMLLDTIWDGKKMEAFLSDYSGSGNDSIIFRYNQNDTVRINIPDANTVLLNSDFGQSLIVYYKKNYIQTDFVIINDSVALFACREMGMGRPTVRGLKLSGNRLSLFEENKSIESAVSEISGQVNYIGYIPNENVLFLHSSGVTEAESGSEQFRDIFFWKIRPGFFERLPDMKIPAGDEKLFLEGNFSDYANYYKKVLGQYRK